MSEKLGKIVSDVIIPNKIAEWLKKGIKIYAVKRDKSNKSVTDLLLEEKKKIQSVLENMYNMEIENDLSETKKEFYRKKEAEYESKLKEINNKLNNIGKNAKQIEEEVDFSIRLMGNLSEWYKIGDCFEKGNIVKALVHEVILTKDNDFVPHYRTPFDIFAESKKNLEENKNVKTIPNVEDVVENLSKKGENALKRGSSLNGLDLEKWGALAHKFMEKYSHIINKSNFKAVFKLLYELYNCYAFSLLTLDFDLLTSIKSFRVLYHK